MATGIPGGSGRGLPTYLLAVVGVASGPGVGVASRWAWLRAQVAPRGAERSEPPWGGRGEEGEEEEEEEEEAAAARGGRGGAAGPAGACPLSAAPPRAELPQGPPRAPPPGRAARGMKLRPSGAGGPGCVSPAGP